MSAISSLWKMRSKAAELRVAIVGQEARPLATLAEIHQQVARLLGHPRRVGVAGTGEVLGPARADRDEEQHVQPAQPDRIDGEEVAGEHRLSVLTEERAPAELVALRRRRDAGAGEHVSHQRRRDGDPELAQLADDPNIAPVAVLAREPQD